MSKNYYPLLSGSLRETLNTLVEKYDDPIAKEILNADKYVEARGNLWKRTEYTGITDEINLTLDLFDEKVDSLITEYGRAVTLKPGTFEASFTPEDKELIYNSSGNWSPQNRQTIRPTKLFRKILKKEFKERPYEIFCNRLKAHANNFDNFRIVSGEDITKYYCENEYFTDSGTLGQSCMRYPECGNNGFFEVYEDNAKMLVLFKENKVIGRALLWEWDGKTFMDRIYVAYDYLVNTFIEYAKANKWYYREHQHLLDDNSIGWYGPDDDYNETNFFPIKIYLPRVYSKMPYVDSICYYQISDNSLNAEDCGERLSDTDGEYSNAFERRLCDCCGEEGDDHTIHEVGVDGDYQFVCENCGRYLEGEGIWIPNNYSDTDYVDVKGKMLEFSTDFINAALTTNKLVRYHPFCIYIIEIENKYYQYFPDLFTWDEDKQCYVKN